MRATGAVTDVCRVDAAGSPGSIDILVRRLQQEVRSLPPNLFQLLTGSPSRNQVGGNHLSAVVHLRGQRVGFAVVDGDVRGD